jgi:ubiquitin carboxyl-terminal hydrolase 5/13
MMIFTAPVGSKTPAGTPVEFEACLANYFADSLIDDFACSVCQQKTACTKRVRFVTFPTVLIAVLAREVYDDWVPKKLEIDLKMTEGPIDFERFKSTGIQGGEHQMPVQEEWVEPPVNMDIVNMLVDMGIPELAAKHAVHNT